MWSKARQYLSKMGGVILVACVIVWALNYFPRHESADKTQQSEQIDPSTDSYLEMIGKAVNPVMEPLGFHWRATVAAIAGIPAKEIVVSTLGVLYTGSEDTDNRDLPARLTAAGPDGRTDFTGASALAFLVFILLYCPCIATVTAIGKETGSWKYAAISAIYNTALAWAAAFATYRLALLF